MSLIRYYEINENKTNWKIELNDNELTYYHKLKLTIITNNYNEFNNLTSDVKILRKWINCNILVINNENNQLNENAMCLCHLAAIYHCTEILKKLIHSGGDLSNKYFEVTRKGITEKLIRKETVFNLIMLHFREPIIILKSFFDNSIKCVDINNDYNFILDFSLLCPKPFARWDNDYKKENQERQMSVLNAILNSTDDIYSDQYKLLQHPLIESYLTCKWKHYRRFFFLLVIMHLLFVICLSTAITLVVKCFQLFEHKSISFILNNNYTSLQDKNENNTNTIDVQHSDLANKFYFYMNLIQILNFIALIIAIFLFIHAIIQTTFIPLKKLIYEFEIIMNLLAAPCAIFTCIVLILLPYEGYFDEDYRWIYHVSCFIILPVWSNLMLLVGRFPRLGCYSLMFTTVLKNFLKVMISFVFLIIGFALSFSLMFPKSEYFKDPAHATLRTIVMMVGEFDYISTFSDEENNFIIGTSRLIFLVFIITCSIILMNLTQGIAVNDIKLLHEISQVIRLEKETRFLFELECVFSHPIMNFHPFLRKIKRKLYDHGIHIEPIRVDRNHRHGLSNQVYNKLMKEYKPFK